MTFPRLLAMFSLSVLSSCALNPGVSPEVGVVPENSSSNTDPLEEAGPSRMTLLDRGVDGFEARLAVIESARVSIDLQYYLWSEDATGLILLDRLHAAAERGVRIRLLLDDFLYPAPDEHIIAVASHPNIEVRFYNPARVDHRTAWLYQLNFLLRFERMDHRMHNKLTVADNRWAVMGGRNIGDDYFGTDPDYNFRDMGVLVTGDAVRGASHAFDHYWNSDFAKPVEERSHLALTTEESQAILAALEEERQALTGPDRFSLPTRFSREDAEQRLGRFQAEAVSARALVVADLPGKSAAISPRSQVLPALLRLEDHARRDIILATPYFIPYEFEIERMQAFTDQGGELRILTNSLASNNQATVHGGYAKQRKKVAAAGVQLFEVRSDANRRAEFTSAPADLESVYGLHGKIGVFDDDRVFLGTFNLDPRSAGLNTEMGLLIESPHLNQQIRETLQRDLLGPNSWKVIVGETGALQWETEEDGQVSRRHSEPPAPLSKRWQAGLSRLLPIKGEL